jgi:hypothetical protein
VASIQRRVVLALLAAASCAIAGAARQTPVRPPELSIRATPELTSVARGLERLDREKFVTVMRVVGLTDPGPPVIVVLAPEDAPVAIETPSWVAGFADSARGVIVIFPARTPSYPYDSMEALLHHEVAHILIGRAAPHAAIPRWFHEGLAMTLERTWGLRDRSEVALALIGGRRSLAAIEDDFSSETRAARAYGVAGAFVRDLIARHGPDFPARLLAALDAGAAFDAAVATSTAVSLAEAERRFWQEGWWYRAVPLLTSSLALWIGVVALAVIARRRRAARRRALRDTWEAEERLLDGLPLDPESGAPHDRP